jgi:hypothetical protein
MKSQALFDVLINGIVTKVNEVLSPTTSSTVAFTDSLTGTVYPVGTRILDVTACGYGDDKQLPAEEVFSRADATRYTEVLGTDGNTYYVYNTLNVFGTVSLYTCSNLVMNSVIVEDYTKLPLMNLEGEVDMEKGEELMEIWEETFSSLDPGMLQKDI